MTAERSPKTGGTPAASHSRNRVRPARGRTRAPDHRPAVVAERDRNTGPPNYLSILRFRDEADSNWPPGTDLPILCVFNGGRLARARPRVPDPSGRRFSLGRSFGSVPLRRLVVADSKFVALDLGGAAAARLGTASVGVVLLRYRFDTMQPPRDHAEPRPLGGPRQPRRPLPSLGPRQFRCFPLSADGATFPLTGKP
jgi:hypothetical protein